MSWIRTIIRAAIKDEWIEIIYIYIYIYIYICIYIYVCVCVFVCVWDKETINCKKCMHEKHAGPMYSTTQLTWTLQKEKKEGKIKWLHTKPIIHLREPKERVNVCYTWGVKRERRRKHTFRWPHTKAPHSIKLKVYTTY